MGGKRILNAAQIHEMCALRESGWTAQRIADHFTAQGTPLSIGSINWQCLAQGADTPPKFRRGSGQAVTAYSRNGRLVRPFSAEEDEKICALDMEGVALHLIAQRLDRPHNSVRARLMTLARRDARMESSQRGMA